jgi:hypothetical protein
MRIMYDSVNPWAIPDSAQIVAGYVDGNFAWRGNAANRTGDWSRFPKSTRLVTISVTGNVPADVLDVERGNQSLEPGKALAWLKWMQGSDRPEGQTMYANGSTWPGLERELSGHDFYRWLADPSGAPHHWTQHPNAGVQYYWGPNGTYDRSAIWNDGWHNH